MQGMRKNAPVTVLPPAFLILDSKLGFTGQVPLLARVAKVMIRPAMAPDCLSDTATELLCGAVTPRSSWCWVQVSEA
ncbi:hypothetical protein RAZWK3B_16410 [Roseobacter sp. AzwK-3b]|nr:hypothetical protein RAZWK3B_16410 [Roseobacter sp. AzwK-3b]